MAGQYEALLKPGKIGPWELPNRVVMAPMGTLNADRDGYVTDRVLKFYKRQAQGHMGLLIVECTYMDNQYSKGEDNCMGLYENGQITGMRMLAQTIHDQGVVAVLQLCHIGHQLSLADHMLSLGPSTMNELQGGIMPFPIRGMSKAEIKECEKNFADAAWRAMMAGFDGVQIHGAIGHLINMFCSPLYNHRTDEYGGSPENRVRFFKEIIEAIQQKCGRQFPVIARVCGDEFDPHGITLEEGIEQAKILEKTGIVCLHVVAGNNNNVRTINAQYDKRGDFLPVAKAFKDAGIKVPIIVDGGLTTPDLAAKVIEDGVADFIGLGRPMLADPDWADKLKENRPEDIRPCIRCTMGCVGTIEAFNAATGLRCSVNPECNMVGVRDVEPMKTKKNVCIIGGGPAGMTAAQLLKERGHDVTIYEKRKLGGTMNEAASNMPFKEDIRILIRYYDTQMKKLGIPIVSEEVTAEKIIAGNYDAVIVATGAPAITPHVKGGDGKIITLKDYAANPDAVELGDTVMIVGGCFMNLEIAHDLALKGKTVYVVSRRGLRMGVMELGNDNSSPQQQRLNILMRQEGIKFLLGQNITEVTPEGAVLKSLKTKATTTIPCDNIIMCRGYHGRPKLYNELDGKVPELYMVGDATIKVRCNDKRVIGDAIEDGWAIGNRI